MNSGGRQFGNKQRHILRLTKALLENKSIVIGGCDEKQANEYFQQFIFHGITTTYEPVYTHMGLQPVYGYTDDFDFEGGIIEWKQDPPKLTGYKFTKI